MKRNIYGHIVALGVVSLWGTTFVSSKVLLNAGMQPAEIFIIRFIMAYVCMLLICHNKLWANNIKDELSLIGLGIMGGSLYFLSENMALIYSTTANVSIIVSTCPLLTALTLAIFYKDERLNRKQVFGSFIAFIGVVLVILNGQLILHLNPLGDTLAFCASISWVLYSLLMRRLMNRYSADFITRKVFFYGIITILPYFAFKPFQLPTEFNATIIGNLLYLGLIASTGGYLLWNWVMKKLGAVKATNFIYFQTLVTMATGAIVLGEKITWMGLTGAIVLISGMIRALKK